MRLRGIVPSPNIWQTPQVYELENQAVDPAGLIESAMLARHDWTGQTFLDVGCGNGFHLGQWAARASKVVGVEPFEPLVLSARRRVSTLDPFLAARVRVLTGSAAALPLPNASVDLVQARWAYFFGPGCEPGLAELSRVVRAGGTAFVIDNDATRSTFGGWFRRSLPRYDPVAVERFWARQGWQRESLDVGWSFRSRADLESVVRIELAPMLAAEILAEHEGTEVDYAVNLRWRHY